MQIMMFQESFYIFEALKIKMWISHFNFFFFFPHCLTSTKCFQNYCEHYYTSQEGSHVFNHLKIFIHALY